MKYSTSSFNKLWSSIQSMLPRNIFNFTIRYMNSTLPTRKNLLKWDNQTINKKIAETVGLPECCAIFRRYNSVLKLEKVNCKQVSSQDSGKIKALMKATYQVQRKDILNTAIPVKDIIKKYPALAKISRVI